MRISRCVTLSDGLLTYLIAREFTTVLDLILHSYSFMVAGHFIPTLGAYFWKKSHPNAAFISMIGGGTVTLVLIFFALALLTEGARLIAFVQAHAI